jgi:hypothetical protein
MPLQRNSKGSDVKALQQFLGIDDDGDFGPITENAVKSWQTANGLPATGIVDRATAEAMGYATTDATERADIIGNLIIERHHLPPHEYVPGQHPKQWIFLHHTAGWNNPFNTIDGWARDTNGRVATEFVIGGQSIRGNDDRHDGTLVQAFPTGAGAFHLGINSPMQMGSVAIELCNFGWVKDGRTWAGQTPDPAQVVTLDRPFRGHRTWHRYSDRQIAVLRDLLCHIADRDGIDVTKGLPDLIRQHGADAFDVVDRTLCERTPGIWSHTNVRTDKTDLFPQPELMDMLVSL